MARRHTSGWVQGNYNPLNPDKYIGKMPIVYRSSWELQMCRMADKHQNVIYWSSESIRIPYFNPVTQKHSVYVPDFFLVYEDKNGNRHAEVIEIKPKKQMTMEKAKSRADKETVAMNMAKWQAAQAYCNRKGLKFRVVNEDGIFGRTKRRK